MNLKARHEGFKVWAGAQADIERVTAIWRDCLGHYGGPYLFGAALALSPALQARGVGINQFALSAIPYVATATVAELRDLEAKVRRAMEIRGARSIHISVPCPLGWGHEAHDTIRIARLVRAETGG